MSGGLFSKKKDRTEMKKIGSFWYPTEFYEAADRSVLGPILKIFFESEFSSDIYEYLITERKLTKANAGAFFYRFIRADSPQAVNISFDEREEVEDELILMFGTLGTEERMFWRRKNRRQSLPLPPGVVQPNQPMHQVTKKQVRDVFQVATHQVYGMAQRGTMTRLFGSKIFQETHRHRQKRILAQFRSYSSATAEKVARQTYEASLVENAWD